VSAAAAGRSGAERKPALLRLDPAVHAALARWAADDLRSFNAHVEWLLRKALLDAGRLPRKDPRKDPGKESRKDSRKDS
jgi:hypothetical protein